jgi:hypothetical protein
MANPLIADLFRWFRRRLIRNVREFTVSLDAVCTDLGNGKLRENVSAMLAAEFISCFYERRDLVKFGSAVDGHASGVGIYSYEVAQANFFRAVAEVG